MKVKLEKIVEFLEYSGDEQANLLDLQTGEIELVEQSLLRRAEKWKEGDDPPSMGDWQKPQWEMAKRYAKAPDQFLWVPDLNDVNEWDVMAEFVDTVKSATIRDELQDAIRGRGAFRMFKNTIRRHKIEQDWYDFRARALEEFARDWCEENGLQCE